jgi:hypothetical protein
MLLLAVPVSAAVGLALNWLASELRCEGEGLACNIDDAVGAYGVLIVACLGPLIFGLALFIATNARVLLGIGLILISALAGFYLLAQFDSWRYVGFYPYPALRSFLVMLAPPLATVLTQWLVLYAALARRIIG